MVRIDRLGGGVAASLCLGGSEGAALVRGSSMPSALDGKAGGFAFDLEGSGGVLILGLCGTVGEDLVDFSGPLAEPVLYFL